MRRKRQVAESNEADAGNVFLRQGCAIRSDSFSTIVNDGRRILVGAFPIVERNQKAYLVVLHDLSFIDARSGEALGILITALAGVATAIAGLAAMFIVVLLRGWMNSLRRAIDEVRSGVVSLPSPRDRSAIDIQIKTLLEQVEGGRQSIGSGQIEWSPTALQSFLQKVLPSAEVLVVSNREPYIHNRADGQISVQTPASGLVSALEPVIRACGGTWIAHGSGDADRETVDREDKIGVPPDAPSYTLRRIWISDEEQDGYYYGLANEGLWPLCHIAFVRPQFRQSDWQQYEAINERFAEAVAQEARTERSDRSSARLSLRAGAADDPAASTQSDDHYLLAYPVAQRRNL